MLWQSVKESGDTGAAVVPDATVSLRKAPLPEVDGADLSAEPTVDETRDLGTGFIPGVDPSVEPETPSIAQTHWSIAPSSPLEALRLEEMERTRTFIIIVYWMSVVIPPCLLFVGGSATMKYILLGLMVVNVASVGRVHYLLRNPDRDLTNDITAAAMIAAITTFTGVMLWGIFSVAPSIMVVGIYFFSRSESKSAALLIYLTCAVMQMASALLFIFEIVPDPAMFQRTGSMRDQLLTQALMQGIYLATYFVARATRESSLGTITKLQSAMQQLSNREVLLQEARQELEQALRVEGAGRYTGQTLGVWNLQKVLGRGAMGEVYEAFHKDSDQKAAIKVLHPEVMLKAGHVKRFLREAKAASSLESKHVVRVLEVSSPSDQVPFIAMEHLAGSDLSHELRNRRKLSIREVLKLVDEVGIVLDLARKKGIVHRDIKPQNLLMTQELGGPPVWKVLDFGVSKLGENSGTLTQGHVVGTPTYMAPEQARGEEVDPSADLYALGAVAYRCLTGRPPFSGKEVATVMFKVVSEMPPRPSVFAKVHDDVDLVVAIAMAKDPANRFGRAAKMSAALKKASAGRLDEKTRELGRAILEETPWNQKI